MSTGEMLAAIERRYGFPLPASYRQMVSAGWIDTSVHESYTPLFMGEWLTLAAILDFDFQSVVPETPSNPGLIPFAQSPGGDPYCWYPARKIDGEAVIGSCEFGDYERIRLKAPSLLGFCYRNVLDQLSTGCQYEDERFAKQNLARWRQTWIPLFPQPWQEQLAAVSESACVEWTRVLRSGYRETGRSFLHPDECQRLVDRDLKFEGIDQWVTVEP